MTATTDSNPCRDNALAYGELQNNLLAFAAYVHLERREFEMPPHIRQIANALERVERGELKRLIISVPPRHGKSTLTSSIWAAWFLGRNPDKRVVVASYGADLSIKASRNARRIVQSAKYRRIFPHVELSSDSASIQLWDLKGFAGGYQAASVGGPLTGFGAHVLVVDDPHKSRDEANSEIERQKVYDWYTSDAFSRLEPNPAEGAVIVIHTRFHPDDLIGRLLASSRSDQWEVIELPAISVDDEGFEQPLWWPMEAYQEAKAECQPLDWQALWMCNPIIPEGDTFHEKWFHIKDRAPDLIKWCRYWDCAIGLKKTNDWSVGVKAGIDDEGNLWIGDVKRVKKNAPDLRSLIKSTAIADGIDTIIGLPVDLIGTPLMQELRRDPEMLPFPMYPVKEKGDKGTRAGAWQSRAAADQLRIVHASWNAEYVAECVAFPNSKWDDCVDATTGAYDLLWSTRGGIKTVEKPPANNTPEYFEVLMASVAERRELNESFNDDY